MHDFVGINPPHPYLANPGMQIPIGLCYVVGGAVQAGYDAVVHDATGQEGQEIVESLPESRVYGITATVLDYQMAENIARDIKLKYPEATVILGGPVWVAERYVDFDVFDCLVKGYADATIADVLFLAQSGRLPRTWEVERTDPDYVDNPYQYWPGQLGGRSLSDEQYADAESAVLLTARGCPNNCAFCGSAKLCGRRVQFRDMDCVFDDVEYLSRERGVKVLKLNDDCFMLRHKRVREFCERIRPYHEQHGVVWRIFARVDTADADLYQLMYDCGCREASIGIESKDQAVLDMLNKGTTVEQQDECLSLLGEAGITRRALLITGCPGTTLDTFRKNARFILDGNYDVLSMTAFSPMPGVPVWENPGQFRCDIPEHAQELGSQQFYLYGPDGARDIEPRIDSWDVSKDVLRTEINTTRILAESVAQMAKG